MLYSTRLVLDCFVLRRKSAVKRRLSVRNPLQQSATDISVPFPRGRTLAGRTPSGVSTTALTVACTILLPNRFTPRSHRVHAGRTTVPFFHMAYPVTLKDAPKGSKAL